MSENHFADQGVESHNSKASSGAFAEKALEEVLTAPNGVSVQAADKVDKLVDKQTAPFCPDCAIVGASEKDLQLMAKIVSDNISRDGNLGAKDARHTLDTVLIHMEFSGEDFTNRMVGAINKDLSDAQTPYYVKARGSGSKLAVELHEKG